MTESIHRWRRFLTSLWTLFNEKNCRQHAAALTYMTLFAIVPLVTVSYAMLSLFPDFAGLESRLQAQIFEHFVPESGREVQEYISNFSTQAQRLTGVGVAILLITAGLMLRNIEVTFNSIWDIPRGRRGVSSFLLYWAILSMGPILLGAGLAASTYLFSQKIFSPEDDGLGVMPIVLGVLPWIFTATAFTLLFVAVPNCRVPLRHGLVGGVVTAFAFEVAKNLFGVMVARSSVQAVYGAFAFVPLFLIWVYLMWMIVLAGCVLVRTLSAYHAAAQGRKYSDVVATLILLWEFFKKYQGGQPLRDQDISRAAIKPAQWRRIRQILQDRKMIAQTERNDYVLSRDLDSTSLMELVEWLNPALASLHNHRELHNQPWYREVEKRFAESQEFASERLALDLGELFREALDKENETEQSSGRETKTKKTGGKGSGKGKSDGDSEGGLAVVGRRNKRV
ncbi:MULTISPECIES: YihY family inner membrane protein [unclassified Microbulbifer]|uniref:YihY family inner membrane protein n=1 Tax=unclassified Microbulbifer TaxID=2619833 RepID=UPI0027E3DE2B|nr:MULTISPECIES: YihY family inner membrane protein [unclassified Microbulbifer]